MAPNDYYDDDSGEEIEEEEEVAPTKKRKEKKWKDPNKPKRALSAFFLYSQAERPKVKEANPELSFGDCARLLAKQYKELPEKEMKKWEKLAEQDKERYAREMESYVPAEDPTGGTGKKAKKQKDPNAPKRNMSAYFLYSVHIRPTIKAENPDAAFGDIARLISEKFKSLPDKEKKIWEEKAAEDKERYQREMAEYKS